MKKYKIQKDGRLCHSKYLNDVAVVHFNYKGSDPLDVDVSGIEKCYSDPEINIPHESLICDLQSDWATFVSLKQPFLGPTPIKYRRTNKSKYSTK